MATVRVEGRPDVVGVEAMGRPRAACCGFVVDDNVCARGSKRGAIEVESSVDLGVGR